jgi:hypothetical protein
MLHSWLYGKCFDASWQSMERIPIVLLLLKEELHQLETTPETDLLTHWTHLQQKLTAYRTLYQYWRQTPLNPRQAEWINEMKFYLDAWQQTIFSSASSVSSGASLSLTQDPVAQSTDCLTP